jgi:gliding motility-associated transport system permease protein
MSKTFTVFKREIAGYFATPVAYVFIVVFLLFTGITTFNIGNFYERGQADLMSFFFFHPWLYLFLIPAISMRLWSEERSSGTIELLMTLPISTTQAVFGKFLAAWFFAGIALALTFPIWITVNVLGEPDNGVIFASYIGSILMAGSYLAIGSLISSLTRNQVIAFVLSALGCAVLVAAGSDWVLNLVRSIFPEWVAENVASFSVQAHFDQITKGIIDLRDIVYFGTLLVGCLVANAITLSASKAD